MSTVIDERSRSTSPGALMELYDVDLSLYGGEVLYLHPYTDRGANVFTFQTNEYQPFPIQSSGWDANTQGTLPRPIIRVGNINGIVTALLRQFGDFVGCQITRHRTYRDYLDDGVEAGSPGNYQEYTPDIYVIDRKSKETNTIVEWELATLFDSEGVSLPRRQVLAGYCPWLYRGVECGYTGPPVADVRENALTATTDRGAYNAGTTYANHDYTYVMVNGIRVYYVSISDGNTSPLSDITKWTRDQCAKTISACKARFGATNPLPTGAFPGASKIPGIQ